MTHEEKINYMRIAAGIAGFVIKNEHLDLLVSVYELILEKKGKANIEDVVKIESEVKGRGKDDDVIKKINNLNMAVRWNYIAKILNGVKVEDIELLSDEQKKFVSNYLLKQSGRFTSTFENER